MTASMTAPTERKSAADTYTTALATLGLHTPAEAAKWLGVSLRTAQRYAVDGPSGPAKRAVELALELRALKEPAERLFDFQTYFAFNHQNSRFEKFENGKLVGAWDSDGLPVMEGMK